MRNSSSEMNRRTALTAIGAAGLGLAAMKLPVFAAAASDDAITKALAALTDRSRGLLRRVLSDPSYSGRIPADTVAALVENEKTTPEKLMLSLLPLAQSYSRAPISNFFVGVVVQGASGSLYTGANIEIPGQCLGFAVHAEQSALSNAYMHEEKSVTALAVGGAPCGHCRQFIDEMSPEGEITILTPDQAPRKLSEILPAAFGPAALGMKDGAFPIREANLALVNSSSDPLTVAALDAARKSYAPYSRSPAGVAIRGGKGRTYRGSYIENVAFNPSLSPLQVALAAMIAAGEPYSAISAVKLVEGQGAKISQRPVTEIVLAAIAPGVKLEVITARQL